MQKAVLLLLDGADEELVKGLTGDLADVRPRASKREPAGGLYSVDLSENCKEPPSVDKLSGTVVDVDWSFGGSSFKGVEEVAGVSGFGVEDDG